MKRLLAATTLVVVACGLSAGSPASLGASVEAKSKPPAGYHTVTVTKAGFSIAVPDAWRAYDLTTQKGQTALAALSPSLAAQRNSGLVLIAFRIGARGNVNVVLFPATRLPSVGDANSQLRQHPAYQEVAVTTTRVAGTSAILATYTQASGTAKLYNTQFVVVVKRGGLSVTFGTGDKGNKDKTVQTMIHSMKLLG